MSQFIKLTRVLRGSDPEVSFPQLYNIDTIITILPEDGGGSRDQCIIVTIGFSDGDLVKESFKTVCDLIAIVSPMPQRKSLVKG
jgi:hypothetical protein